MIKDIGDKTMSLGDYVGLRIKFLRESKNLTLTELALLLPDLTVEKLMRYEEGVERPPSRVVRSVLKKLGANPDEFFI